MFLFVMRGARPIHFTIQNKRIPTSFASVQTHALLHVQANRVSDTDQLKMASSSGSAEEGTIEEASEEVIEQDEIEAEGNTNSAAIEEEENKTNEDEEEPWKLNPFWKTRLNSPSSRKMRSDVWKTFLRLEDDHPHHGLHTHICTIDSCPEPLVKLVKPKGKDHWGTTKAVAHLNKFHQDSPENADNLERSVVMKVSLYTSLPH